MKTLIKLKKQHEFKFWHNFDLHLLHCYHTTLIGSLIFHGNKIRAFEIFLKMRLKIKLKGFTDFYFIFLIAMRNITPQISLSLFRLGAVSKKIPFPITESKQISFAIKWIKSFSKDSHGMFNISKFIDLLLISFNNKGEVVEKKNEIHKTALENRYLLKYLK